MNLLEDGCGDKGVLIFAHGAGMPMDHLYMQQLVNCFVGLGLKVFRFEFPYMNSRRINGKQKFPDKLPVLEAHFIEVVAQIKQQLGSYSGPVYLGGKSLGGRVASLVADKLAAEAVFVVRYPFHPIKKPETLRVEHLKDLATPLHIFQGERDKFGTPGEVVHYSLSKSVSIYWFEDGDHDLRPRKKSGYSLDQHFSTLTRLVSAVVI